MRLIDPPLVKKASVRSVTSLRSSDFMARTPSAQPTEYGLRKRVRGICAPGSLARSRGSLGLREAGEQLVKLVLGQRGQLRGATLGLGLLGIRGSPRTRDFAIAQRVESRGDLVHHRRLERRAIVLRGIVGLLDDRSVGIVEDLRQTVVDDILDRLGRERVEIDFDGLADFTDRDSEHHGLRWLGIGPFPIRHADYNSTNMNGL